MKGDRIVIVRFSGLRLTHVHVNGNSIVADTDTLKCEIIK